jgi:hypothetical protein
MRFTPDDFVKMEAQRQALVQQYITQRAANGATMTDDELKVIEARANAAAPGPWRRDMDVVRDAEDFMIVGPDERYTEQDADFIAAARTDVPTLVAEVRRLRALCRRGGELLNGAWYDAPAGTISDVKAIAGELEVAGRE